MGGGGRVGLGGGVRVDVKGRIEVFVKIKKKYIYWGEGSGWGGQG